ncbi:MAG: hypothetical protein KJ579_02455 [Verrucomicrobia bacterium]|nr:hypothetical protein [Verrucomicrobiota bacterium]
MTKIAAILILEGITFLVTFAGLFTLNHFDYAPWSLILPVLAGILLAPSLLIVWGLVQFGVDCDNLFATIVWCALAPVANVHLYLAIRKGLRILTGEFAGRSTG